MAKQTTQTAKPVVATSTRSYTGATPPVIVKK
jgi:hypothetical protein